MSIKKWWAKRKAGVDKEKSRTFWTIVVLVVVVAYMIFIFSRSVWRSYEINRSIANLEEEIDGLETRLDYNKNLISYYKSRSFLEKESRSQLGMKKEGETVLALPRANKENDTKELEIEGLPKEKELSNIEKWWHFFF